MWRAAALTAVLVTLVAAADSPARDMSMSTAARDYLEHALTLLEMNALDRRTVDWRQIRIAAYDIADNAREPADTYPAIRGAIAAIGNPHTTFSPPALATAPPPAPAEIQVPAGEPLADGVAVLTIPSFRSDAAAAARYMSAGQDAVRRLDPAARCGWVVDLRTNNGGDMWPMLTVLAPLLGDGPLGSFATPDGAEIQWAIHNGDVLLDSKVMGTNPLPLTHPTPPIAVLTSATTASSGEATLVAFLGLNRARTFGLPTAGLATANQGFHLADGALITLTTAVMVDRTGHHHGPPITPDVRATQHAGTDIAAATTWLANRPGC